jgi:hypothetical protein
MDGAPHERLRRARAACGEDLSALARRTGVRLNHLRAIEEGRFDDLPPGIYARAAVRTFAAACGLDPAAVLADCEPCLPRIDDPIDALARKHGLAVPTPAADHVPAHDHDPSSEWRTFAAAAVDATLIGALLIVVVVSVALAGRVTIGDLSASAGPFAVVGVLMAGGYFAWFGGLCGTTLGRVSVHTPAMTRESLTLRTIAARALLAATDDARSFVRLGGRAARGLVRPASRRARNVPRLARALSRLRRLDLGPARWSPASRPGAAPPQPLPRPRG